MTPPDDRFTDAARNVMQRANQEAHTFHHEYIGAEHILVGLVMEGPGIPAGVLLSFGIDPANVRLEVYKIIQGGMDMRALGQLPHTPRAKNVIAHARKEATRLHQDHVVTAHLLVGLLLEEEGLAAQILMNMGLTLVDVREEIRSLRRGGAPRCGARCNVPGDQRAYQPGWQTYRLWRRRSGQSWHLW
jgi:ATP-dependent Clp protease ATP-binding subunit ClpC